MIFVHLSEYPEHTAAVELCPLVLLYNTHTHIHLDSKNYAYALDYGLELSAES